MKRISLIPILFLALLLSLSVVSASKAFEKEKNATIDYCTCGEGEVCCADGGCCRSGEYCCSGYCCSAQEYAAFTSAHGLPHN
ncbi:unnamed protein product [Victoria cruziana]